MYSGLIRSEKELEALRHEIGSLKGRKADLEDSLAGVDSGRHSIALGPGAQNLDAILEPVKS